MSPDELTRLLLEGGALREGGRVTEVAAEAIGTFSTELVRLRVRFEGATALPASFVLKRRAPGRAERLGERMETEIRFYRELSPALPVQVPRFFGGDAAHGVLLLEDVGPLPPTDWAAGPDPSHARAAVSALARLHAAFAGSASLPAWIPSFADRTLLAAFEERYERGWRQTRPLFVEAVPELAALGDRLVGRVAESHAALAEAPTLLHGDAHAENLPLLPAAADGPGREVLVLDWAGPRIGSAGVDLGFFVAMSFPAERRRQVEEELLALHTEVVSEAGAAPAQDPRLGYRRGVLRRFTRLVGIAPDWPEDALAGLRMLAHRCGRAAVELEVGELV